MQIFSKRSDAAPAPSPASARHRIDLIRDLTFEIVPMKSLGAAVDALPTSGFVSVTCSPTKGIAETQRVTEDLQRRGHRPIPHIAARLVRDRAHVTELARWLRNSGLERVFLVGGDAPDAGAYPGAVELLADLLDTDHGLDAIGVAAYPDGHAFLSDRIIDDALRTKQAMLRDAGVAGYCSTQMCFDPHTVAAWLTRIRGDEIDLAVHLGISGVVDKAKLLRMGVRLGIGQSLGYLKKNRAAVAKMLTSSAYDLDDLLVPLQEDLVTQGVTGLHVFTFNQVEATNTWREAQLAAITS